MRHAYSIPAIDQPARDQRPFLEAPAPARFDQYPMAPQEDVESDDDKSPRVIIIDI
jgi:hypothetical protein